MDTEDKSYKVEKYVKLSFLDKICIMLGRILLAILLVGSVWWLLVDKLYRWIAPVCSVIFTKVFTEVPYTVALIVLISIGISVQFSAIYDR